MGKMKEIYEAGVTAREAFDLLQDSKYNSNYVQFLEHQIDELNKRVISLENMINQINEK